MKQYGFTIIELLTSLLLASLISIVVYEIITIAQKRYEIAQAVAELNQKEILIRDILEKTIDKAGVDNAKKLDEYPIATDFSGDIATNGIIDINDEVLVIAYNSEHSIRCDGKDIEVNASVSQGWDVRLKYADIFYIANDTTVNNIPSLYCRDPNNSGTYRGSLISAYVNAMDIRYTTIKADGNVITVPLSDLLAINSANKKEIWNIFRVEINIVIATDSDDYQDTPNYVFNSFSKTLSYPSDGRYRRLLSFVFAPKGVFNENG